jgi:hypothetical protein
MCCTRDVVLAEITIPGGSGVEGGGGALGLEIYLEIKRLSESKSVMVM